MSEKAKDNIMPMGKYKGQPIEVLDGDPQYRDWLCSQSWFREKFGNQYTLIVNNFTEPSCTPEHNRIQSMFLDDVLCQKMVQIYILKRKFFDEFRDTHTKQPEFNVKPARFEYHGIDVMVFWNLGQHYGDLGIEIKPTMSDDFPDVLRQMKKNGSVMLLLEQYTGHGATFNQVKKMFAAENRQIVTVDEITCYVCSHDLLKIN